MSRKARWPSGGFVALLLTYVGVALFFLWGFSTPALDRVWTLHHLLKCRQIERMDESDRELLRATMARHAELARALLHGHDIGVVSAHDDGWIATRTVTILRTAQAGEGTEIVLDVQAPPDLLPLSVEVQALDWRRELTVDRQGREGIALPAPTTPSELLELTVVHHGPPVDASSLGIRISFEVP